MRCIPETEARCCSLTAPPEEVVSEGVAAIAAYFRKQQLEQQQQQEQQVEQRLAPGRTSAFTETAATVPRQAFSVSGSTDEESEEDNDPDGGIHGGGPSLRTLSISQEQQRGARSSRSIERPASADCARIVHKARSAVELLREWELDPELLEFDPQKPMASGGQVMNASSCVSEICGLHDPTILNLCTPTHRPTSSVER